jgi:hypothetical protein
MSKLLIANEPLSWELLDYWKASGLPPCSVRAAPIVVARREEKIVGFAALGRDPGAGYGAVIEPLVSNTFHVGVKVLDEMERLLWSAGVRRYAVYLNEYTKKDWQKQVERVGLFERLGQDESGAMWYARSINEVEKAA